MVRGCQVEGLSCKDGVGCGGPQLLALGSPRWDLGGLVGEALRRWPQRL